MRGLDFMHTRKYMEAPNRRGVHAIVKIILLWHVVAITLWSVPQATDRFNVYKNPLATPRELANAAKPDPLESFQIWNDTTIRRGSWVRDYLSLTGTWQYWDMFAPNPSNLDFYVTAEIACESKWYSVEYPRMSKMGLAEKYTKERFRKFIERAHTEQFSYLWPYLAQRMAREFKQSTGKNPTKIILVRHFRILPGPDKIIPDYQEFRFFTYVVRPEDLAR